MQGRMNPESRLPKFYQKSLLERQKLIDFNPEAKLNIQTADKMIENVVGVFGLPLGVAANFVIDNQPVLVPMCTEEASIIAACSNAAKIISGFTTAVDEPVMMGQILISNFTDADRVTSQIKKNKLDLINQANQICESMFKRGGGCQNISARILDNSSASVDFEINTCDAMGANAINTVLEGMKGKILELCGGELCMAILSNYSTKRMGKAEFEIDVDSIGGIECARKIVAANHFAKTDKYRAVTHNKGIFNGIDAVAIATGNDWRAIEAGGHAYACKSGDYQALTNYRIDKSKQTLRGELSMPMAIGVVGGSTKIHPTVRENMRILNGFSKSSKKLAAVMVSVGLAQNFGALRALVCEGIQQGHMRLHARKG